ncbi:BRCA1 associated RING domain 1 [Chamberlinius hualienensis]
MDKETVVTNGESIQQPQQIDVKNILKGLIAYVDIRSGEENRTETFKYLLRTMGATVTPGLNKTVTHVIFRDGPKKTYEKAKKRGLFILSAAWVSSCLKNGHRVPEEQFPAMLSSDYDSPFAKIRMVKSLRPLSFEEYQKRDNANRKRIKTRRERKEIRLKYLKTPPALHIPQDYSKYGPITLPPPLLLPDLPEEDYDIEDPYTLPLSLRILQKSPFPNSPVLDFLTSDKQRQVAKQIIRKYGNTLNSTNELTSTRMEDSSPLPATSLTNNEVSMIKSSPDSPISTESNNKGFDICINGSTPKSNRKRKRAQTPPEKLSISKVEINLSLNNSLKDFKLTKRIKKHSNSRNLNDLLNVSDDMSLAKSIMAKHIALTSYDNCGKDTVVSIIHHLGSSQIEKCVGKKTTHVICGLNRRTYNVLLGVVLGCWILDGDWVMDSLEAGSWLNEQKYELAAHFPAAQISRQRKEKMGADYQFDLFKNIGSIFIAHNTTLPRHNLSYLLVKAGAKVVISPRKADIVIGSLENKRNCTSVSEQWALDSIVNYSVRPLKDYEYQET